MLSTMWIAFIVVFVVAFVVLVTLVLIGMVRATKRVNNNPTKAKAARIPDASQRNRNTHIDSDNVKIN